MWHIKIQYNITHKYTERSHSVQIGAFIKAKFKIPIRYKKPHALYNSRSIALSQKGTNFYNEIIII
jgi:hypothetical protein